MTFEQVLEEIADVGRTLTTSRLTGLSDLSAGQQNKLTETWPRIPTLRKERIVRLLADLAEDNVELDFEAVFRIAIADPDATVRVVGIDGLCECTERWLLDRLILMVRNDEAEEVRAAAAEAMGRFALKAELGDFPPRDTEKIDLVLLAVFEDEMASTSVRRKAIESLGVRNTERVSAAIRHAYASDQYDLRLGSIFAMGRSASEQWVNTIVGELTNDDPEMRYEAATALGEIEDERTVPYLVPLLGDDDLQVRLNAIAALGHIGSARAKEELRRCLSSPDEQTREAAEEALEEVTFGHNPFSFGIDADQN
ncbi:MAG: HEAT repeat domain-containing protein [Dehalococcoidia bacterium]|nr:HEAT repeat domain-containing protein [Dehalococcoidia bacterium]